MTRRKFLQLKWHWCPLTHWGKFTGDKEKPSQTALGFPTATSGTLWYSLYVALWSYRVKSRNIMLNSSTDFSFCLQNFKITHQMLRMFMLMCWSHWRRMLTRYMHHAILLIHVAGGLCIKLDSTPPSHSISSGQIMSEESFCVAHHGCMSSFGGASF